jgi:hypothetical protein
MRFEIIQEFCNHVPNTLLALLLQMTAIGVPIGPQSQVQNAAEVTTATGDSPVLWPTSIGSMTWPVSGSTIRNNAAVHMTMLQSGPTAAARISGKTAEIRAPM